MRSSTVVAEQVELPSRAGTVPASVYRRPVSRGQERSDSLAEAGAPAIVLGVEAYGPNEFARSVATRLAELGYVVIVPDYYRGRTLSDPDNYLDFTEVITFIDELDFTTGAHDQLAAVRYAAQLPEVDPRRIAVWGYCTGATLSMLAATVSEQVAAAVLFFPSQPRFAELTDRRPVHPANLLWALRCPALLMYGDQDGVMTETDLAELRRRARTWHLDLTIMVYPGAGHAFTTPVPPLRNDAADAESWQAALDFLRSRTGPPSRPDRAGTSAEPTK